MRSALEWAQVRALAAEGVSQREIARRLGINRRTVARLAASGEPPRYRAGAGRLAARSARAGAAAAARGVAADQGAAGDRDPARRLRLRRLGRSGASAAARAAAAGGAAGAADRLPAGAGAAARLGRDADPADARRSRAARLRAGRRRCRTRARRRAFFSLRHDDRVVPRGPRARVRVAGRGAARVRLRQPALGRRPPRAASEVVWNQRFLHLRGHYALPRDRLHAGDAAREGLGRGGGALPEDRLLAGAALRLDLRELDDQYADWRDRVCNRARARDRPLPRRRAACRGARGAAAAAAGALRLRRATAPRACRSTATCKPRRLLLPGAGAARARSGSSCASTATRSGSCHRGAEVARYQRSYEQGIWLPPPMHAPRAAASRRRRSILPRLAVAPPELADYAELVRMSRQGEGRRAAALPARAS